MPEGLAEGADGTDTEVVDAVSVESAKPTIDEVIAEATSDPAAAPEVTPTTETSETYKVKVDGAELDVPLDELLSGYQRQSDYTRKTQELAAERDKYAAFDALDAAFADDPQGTLRALAEGFGIEFPTDSLEESLELDEFDDDLENPLASEVQELKQWRQAQEDQAQQAAVAEREAAIHTELDALEAADPSLNRVEILQYAIDHGLQDLADAADLLSLRKAKTAKAEVEAEVVETKRNLPPVEGGSARTPKGTQVGSSAKPSLEEAWNAALSEHR